MMTTGGNVPGGLLG